MEYAILGPPPTLPVTFYQILNHAGREGLLEHAEQLCNASLARCVCVEHVALRRKVRSRRRLAQLLHDCLVSKLVLIAAL